MAGGSEFLCGKHYPLVDKRLRRLRTRVRLKVRRVGWTPALIALSARLWLRARQQALDRTGAIGPAPSKSLYGKVTVIR
jgi:hypothetical protein